MLNIKINQKQSNGLDVRLVPQVDNFNPNDPAFDKLDINIIKHKYEAGRFSGKLGQHFHIAVTGKSQFQHITFVGTGLTEELSGLTYETIGAHVYKAIQNEGYENAKIVIENPTHAARLAAGARLAAYRFDHYKTKLKDTDLPDVQTLWIKSNGAEREYKRFGAIVDGVYLSRDLVTEPANEAYPKKYTARILKLKEDGVDVEILDEAELADLGMRALLAVGQGSRKESQVVIMHWNGNSSDKEAPIVLVGKGVTFDAGGISIKPANNMEEMKGDMGGSASVVGTLRTLARRQAKLNVIGIVGLVENMPDGDAFRPSDIITAADGQTIEVQNTDAEGRLVLADLLWLAQTRYSPKVIVDLATLTGNAVRSLGNEHVALFSNNDELANQLLQAGQTADEQAWRMPMNVEYNKLLDSQFADMKNVAGEVAGAITAAHFLARFVNEDQIWAHLDMGSMAYRNDSRRPTNPTWAVGFGPRILDTWLHDTYEGELYL